jgi:hypothetical protein
MNRSGGPFAALFFSLTVSSFALVGCGEDELSDEPYGSIDLAPYFYDGSSGTNPISGLPRNLRPIPGWNNGLRAEYYDFGLVNHTRRRSSTGQTLREPDIAYVHPIYFFFDSAGRPLFSKPMKDDRTGLWHMRGGKGVLNPNPIKAPENRGRDTYFSVPYSVRVRNSLGDFQRPVIDKLHDDRQYTGLWEIYEITVQDPNYEPDAIKSAKTIKAGIESGKLIERRTTKVINCPALDDRTYVTPSAMAYNIPRPRMEIWYRTKLGSCYLIHGIETLGELAEDGTVTTLYRAGKASDARRLDTFDVIRYTIGDERNQVLTVVVPVQKLYTPRVRISSMNPARNNYDIRYFGDDLTVARPRQFPDDPPGYSPIVWLWDVAVSQDPPYEAGTFKDISEVDPALASARDGGSTVWTRNYPLIGVAIPCRGDHGPCVQYGLECNMTPGDLDLLTNEAPPGKNLIDLLISREGGPRCDIPASEYGGYCAPGVARCHVHVEADSENERILRELTGATLDKDGKLTGGIPAGPTASVSGSKADFYKQYGYTKNFNGYGYKCHPITGGYCMIRCDNAASKSEPKTEVMLEVTDPRDPKKKNEWNYTFTSDTRCGGAKMLGYRCSGDTSIPDKQRVCLRSCSSRNTDFQNEAICKVELDAPVTLSDGIRDKTDFPGTICFTAGGASGCAWNPDFEPRDPRKWPGE